jgi:hypothetical protein
VADQRRRVVVEVEAEVHRELRKVALFNDLKVYELTNALLEDVLENEEHVKAVVKRYKLELKP